VFRLRSFEVKKQPSLLRLPDPLQGHSLIKCLMTFGGEHRRVVAHFDKAHFNQSLQMTWADGRSFRSLGFDIAQCPALNPIPPMVSLFALP